MTTNVIKIALGLLTTCALAHAQIVRDDSKEVATDTETGLMWQDNEEAKTVEKNWADAKTYCENLTLGGYHDWFLPTVDELSMITVDTRVKPAIQEGFKYVGGSVYWSSSPLLSYESNAWNVNFDRGDTYAYDKSSTSLVRCARDSTGTSSLLAAHNAKIAKVDKTIKIAQAKHAQEEKERKIREAQEEKERKIREAQEEKERLMEEKKQQAFAAKCDAVEVFTIENIGRPYRALGMVTASTLDDLKELAVQKGGNAIIGMTRQAVTEVHTNRYFFIQNSIGSSTQYTYRGTAVRLK